MSIQNLFKSENKLSSLYLNNHYILEAKAFTSQMGYSKHKFVPIQVIIEFC